MFKKTKIAAATIALLGAAAAQNVAAVSFDDVGTKAQVLIFPYYNVNNNFQTAINIRNTKNVYKAIKIRFRESKYSNDVLDFNLYMSPYDHWSATIKNVNGIATIQSADSSCTFPRNSGQIISNGDAISFIGSVYKNTTDVDAREGYAEVIEMGEIDPTLKPDGTTTTAEASGTIAYGLKHVSSTKKPSDCSVLTTAWGNIDTSTGLDAGGTHAFHQSGAYATSGAVTVDASGNTTLTTGTFYGDTSTVTGLTPPTGGLQGFSYLLDLTNGTAFTADPAMIANYSTIAQHYRPDSIAFYLLPSLASGNVVSAVTPNANLNGKKVNVWAPVAKDWGKYDPEADFKDFAYSVHAQGSGINPFPIADVLSATGVTNDFIYNTSTKSDTDWVVTFPMRKHGIFNGWTYNAASTVTTETTNTSGVVTNVPFFDYNLTYPGVNYSMALYDREETVAAVSSISSYSPPVPVTTAGLKREVNVIQFTTTSSATSLTGSNNAVPKNPGTFTSGWGVMSFTDANNIASLATAWSTGLPTESVVDTATAGTFATTGDYTLAQTGVTATASGIPALGFSAMRGAYSSNLATDIVGETVRHTFTRSR